MEQKREIRWIETRDDEEKLVLLLTLSCDLGQFEVRVGGYTSSGYEMAIRGLDGPGRETLKYSMTGADAKFWGVALVWASPMTIGNLVYDVLKNA